MAHAADEALLLLQARSMRLHLAPRLAGEIVVVENFGPGGAVAWRGRLLAEYGHLADGVRFVPASAFGPMPQAAGWWTQQALKLLAASAALRPRIVVLDAKNHLVRPLDLAYLEAPDGRMRSRRHCYRAHPLRAFLERTLAFCGLPAEPHLGAFMQADTPLTVDRADADRAIALVEARTGQRFAAGLIGARITEFFLLAATLLRAGALEARYEFSRGPSAAVWGGVAAARSLREAIRDADASGTPFFSVHRAAARDLDGSARARLAGFWTRRGLFASEAEARAALARIGEEGAAG